MQVLSYCQPASKQIYSGFSATDPLWYQKTPFSLLKVTVCYGAKSRTYYLGLAAQYLLNGEIEKAFNLHKIEKVNPTSLNEKGEILTVGKIAVKLGKMYPFMCAFLSHGDYETLGERCGLASLPTAKIINTMRHYLENSTPEKLARITYRLYDLYQTIALLSLYNFSRSHVQAEVRSRAWEVIQKNKDFLHYTIKAFSPKPSSRKRSISALTDPWLFLMQNPGEPSPVKKCCIEKADYNSSTVEYTSNPALTLTYGDIVGATEFHCFPRHVPVKVMSSFLQFRQKHPQLYCTQVITDAEQLEKELLIFKSCKKTDTKYLLIPTWGENSYSALLLDINKSTLFCFTPYDQMLNGFQVKVFVMLSHLLSRKIVIEKGYNLLFKDFTAPQWMTGFCLIDFIDGFFSMNEGQIAIEIDTEERLLGTITPAINDYVQFYSCFQLELPPGCNKLYRTYVNQFAKKGEAVFINKFQKNLKKWNHDNLITCLIFLRRACLTENIIEKLSHTSRQKKILFSHLESVKEGREELVTSFINKYKEMHPAKS